MRILLKIDFFLSKKKNRKGDFKKGNRGLGSPWPPSLRVNIIPLQFTSTFGLSGAMNVTQTQYM